MSAFLRTLFGDVATVAVVAAVMAAEVALVALGDTAYAVVAVPCLVLVGTAWLAQR